MLDFLCAMHSYMFYSILFRNAGWDPLGDFNPINGSSPAAWKTLM